MGELNITKDSILVSFHIANMFPDRESDFPPVECIPDALKLCSECSNYSLMVDGTAMGPHMSHSYNDIAILT